MSSSCSLCRKSLATEEEAGEHALEHHASSVVESNSLMTTSFPCVCCPQAFHLRSSLFAHIASKHPPSADDGKGAPRSTKPHSKYNLQVPGLGDSLDQFAVTSTKNTDRMHCRDCGAKYGRELASVVWHHAGGQCGKKKQKKTAARRSAHEWEQLAVLQRQIDASGSNNNNKRRTKNKPPAVGEEEATKRARREYELAAALLLMETGLGGGGEEDGDTAAAERKAVAAVSKLANEVYNLIESFGLTAKDVDKAQMA